MLKRSVTAGPSIHGDEILPLAFGEATKTVPYIMDGIKEYSFTARWGESRDTDDAEGNVTGHPRTGLMKRQSVTCCPVLQEKLSKSRRLIPP